ncbi:MAG: type II toxin-antitoxin system VapC family toxin [Candidatus Eremiobacteraeota bacterium]|nr:type II toxin-antitoxin system VapC family toxin [Candidatus Eremiobacteraeota bacterium]
MRGFLLDTNVISEPGKAAPDSAVMRWLNSADERDLFLSVLTFGEISRGVALLPVSKKRTRHERFLTQLDKRFDGRILALDRAVAERWGMLSARCVASGSPMPTVDAMLAATALAYDLTMVTRNVSDFRHAGIPLIDPFAAVSPSSATARREACRMPEAEHGPRCIR